MKSILSRPPVLQEVWTAVYAAGIKGELARFRADGECSEPGNETLGDWAEAHAWEAVRRANGGVMPEEKAESVVCGPREPTDEEMVEALAVVIASAQPGVLRVNVDPSWYLRESTRALRGESSEKWAKYGSEIALASWKAARAWRKK